MSNAATESRINQAKRDELARLETEQLDRQLHPWLYEQEIPAVWNYSDLDDDARRDEGKR